MIGRTNGVWSRLCFPVMAFPICPCVYLYLFFASRCSVFCQSSSGYICASHNNAGNNIIQFVVSIQSPGTLKHDSEKHSLPVTIRAVNESVCCKLAGWWMLTTFSFPPFFLFLLFCLHIIIPPTKNFKYNISLL